MAKESFYFSHDFNARNDRKLIKVKLKHRQSGIGIYWSIVEMLFEENGFLPLSEIPTIAGDLREKEITVLSVINDFDLFENDGKYFWSNSAKRRIDKRSEKSEKAKESIRKRWQNTNVLPTKNDGNTIKGKESKIKESIKENKKENNFPSMPKNEDVKNLPEQKITSAIELMKITQQTDVTKDEIVRLWEVFKIQNLTGKKYYQDLESVHSHFINWVKTQKINKNIRTPAREQNSAPPLRTADQY